MCDIAEEYVSSANPWDRMVITRQSRNLTIAFNDHPPPRPVSPIEVDEQEEEENAMVR